MRNTWKLCGVLAILGALGSEAGADAIQYSGSQFANIPGGTPVSMNLPDLTTGGTVTLGNSGGYLPIVDPGGSAADPPATQPINNQFSFAIGENSATSSATSSPALVTVTGNITGAFIGPSGSPLAFSGGYSGTATSITIASSVSGPLPPPLQELAANPGRVHINGVVTGGPAEAIDVTLTIDPASVPEPSTLVIFLMAGAGVVVCRRIKAARVS